MDLMGDIGAADQLLSAREENKVLKAKVEELKNKVKELTVSNASLLAEVKMYRKEAAMPSFSNLALGGIEEKYDMSSSNPNGSNNNKPLHDFVSSGNGVYPSDPAVYLPNIHGISNPLCCALDKSDTILATGGADSYVSLTAWGAALAPTEGAAIQTVNGAARISLTAPVICICFSYTDNVVAAGCMDGSVHLMGYKMVLGRVEASLLTYEGNNIKFTKYVKTMAFSPCENILASGSADGTVQFSKIMIPSLHDDDGGDDNDEAMEGSEDIVVEEVKSLHLTGAIEALCYMIDGTQVCLYERDTSYLAYFDLRNDYKVSTFSLNGSITGGFDSHVSFAVMHLSTSPDGQYLCAATDASRNIVMELGTSNIVRDLYGHKNDGFSQPRVAWSSNGQYIYGNTQEDSSICVWDIASTKLVRRLNAHTGQLRDIFSSKNSDTVATASYDKSIRIWLNEMC